MWVCMRTEAWCEVWCGCAQVTCFAMNVFNLKAVMTSSPWQLGMNVVAHMPWVSLSPAFIAAQECVFRSELYGLWFLMLVLNHFSLVLLPPPQPTSGLTHPKSQRKASCCWRVPRPRGGRSHSSPVQTRMPLLPRCRPSQRHKRSPSPAERTCQATCLQRVGVVSPL